MLSRLANNLFWMGRYMERAEYLARYAMVHYYSALDAPFLHPKEEVHASVLKFPLLYDGYKELYEDFSDDNVLHYLFLDPYNLGSVRYNLMRARENARGSRDLLLTELWESINILYHRVNHVEHLDMETFDLMTRDVRSHISVINGYIDNTLIHNEVWALFKAGQHFERCIQVTRLLEVKWAEIQEASKTELGQAYENYLTITMLRSAESFDMSRIYFKRVPETEDALLFILSNSILPRSVAFNLEALQRVLKILDLPHTKLLDQFNFKIARLTTQLQYLVPEDFNDDPGKYFADLRAHLIELAYIFDKEYLL
jgi:uncharacterized alpha-E superfamily protein